MVSSPLSGYHPICYILLRFPCSTGSKLYDSEKYQMTEHMLNPYTWSMNLTIRNLQMGDFRTYLCSSDNGLGSDEAIVRLQGEQWWR